MRDLKTTIPLVFASVILLAATAYIFAAYGGLAYWAVFHRPLGIHLISQKEPLTQELPSFQASASVASTTRAVGEAQTITVSLTASQATQGYVEVWIEGPNNKQVFRSPTGQLVTFVKDSTQTFTYTYALAASLSKGDYKVSAIVTSPNEQTDYYVNINFARFVLI